MCFFARKQVRGEEKQTTAGFADAVGAAIMLHIYPAARASKTNAQMDGWTYSNHSLSGTFSTLDPPSFLDSSSDQKIHNASWL